MHPSDAQSDSFADARRRMVHDQIQSRGVTDERVLEAMRLVPRHEFVPPSSRELAHADRALPIEGHQTISQPYTVAFMCQALRLRGDERVLEAGTGSGYGAAVLSRLARQVLTIERVPELAESARERLARLGFDNVRAICGDASHGVPDEGLFEAIVVTAGATGFPAALAAQLAEGGRLVIPIGSTHAQTMRRYTRRGDQFDEESLGEFVFVPFVVGPT